MSLDLSTEKTR